ncbi:hypothetical protein ACWGH8_30930 [Nonomuraea muscovyensis]|uniref:Uncharacterized protein n=1 Tax=Nonomuraea muscovyensis TaxID=1124761 RepID=A0A7X0CCA0_9ACTN|nr:hypothetical protein [Nonomuraea muscovyensis]MBB6351496.1 hypothetical protein [Nonomuraea muscovyensis]
MGNLRIVLAFGLALLSLGAVVWCTAAARPVGDPPRPTATVPPDPWEPVTSPSGLETSPEREATTEVTVARAVDADLAGVPDGRLDERRRQVKVSVTHRLLMDADDELVATLRRGSGFPEGIQRFTDDGFGPLKVGGTILAPTTRRAPVLTTVDGRTTVEFRVTLLRQLEPDDLLELSFGAPTTSPPLVGERVVTLLPGEWSVLRTWGVLPSREEPERLEFRAGAHSADVTLAHELHGFPDVQREDDFSWETALGVLTAVVMVALLLRALGLSWWERVPNRELAVGLALAAPAMLVTIVATEWKPVAYVILFFAVPLLAVRHAGRSLPTSPPWTVRDLLGATALGVLLAVGMLSWSWVHGQLPGRTLVAGALVAALAAAGAAVGFSADLGVRIVIVRLAVLAAGAAVTVLALALWAKALLTGAYPPDSVRLVLALAWALIPFSAVAVATRQWTHGGLLAAVTASLLVQGWPTEWLDAGSWSLPLLSEAAPPRIGFLVLDPMTRGLLGLLLLGFALLVLRLRRLGDTVSAISHPSAEATMIVCLMVLYLTPRGSILIAGSNVPLPLLSITSVVAWIAVRSLLVTPHPAIVEPTSADEHRELVRKALHKRLLLVSEQELYRIGRGRIGAGEMSMAEFDGRRHDLEEALRLQGRDPETAFATAAGCPPWVNGVHGFVVGLLLSMPFAFLYGWPSGVDLSSFVFDTRYLLTLPAFGFLFGYFYPRVRGTQPMTKALHLMAAALLTELSGYVSTLVEPDIGVMDKVQAVAIVGGQVALVCIGLGLTWEWRLMHLAGEPWGRVRNVRSLRSLATPLLAIVIAAVTTAATSAAGQTVERILQGDDHLTGAPR